MSNALFRLKTNLDSKENVSKNRNEFNESTVLENLNDVKRLFAHVKRLKHRPLRDVLFHRVNEILNVHFDEETVLLEMNDDFKKTLKKTYIDNSQWSKIRSKFFFRKNQMNISNDMNFVFKKNRLYYVSIEKIFRLCISWNKKKKVFHLIHDQNHHCEFHRIYVRAVEAVYIKHLTTRLRRYIRYCRQCQKKQTTKHVSYEQLISIKIMILFFHIVIIDFIVALPFSELKMNVVFIITDKYFKRVSMLSKMTTWSTS